MKTPDSDRRQFLRELFESERGDCGPTAEQVSRLVREERERRRQQRGIAIATAVVTAIATLASVHLWTPRLVPVVDIPHEPPAILNVATSASFAIETVDDAGLLEMLKDQPVALASLPNGERRLMMIVQTPPLAAATSPR